MLCQSDASLYSQLTKLVAILGLIGLLGACTPAASTTNAAAQPSIALEPCQLSAPDLPLRIAAECGTVRVYENRATQTGRQIELHFAVVRATRRNVAPNPLFFLTGGPGQAATESYVQVSSAFRGINQERDIVLVDQRGTGKSHPLRCPEPAESDTWFDAADPRFDTYLQQCLAQLDADPTQYTTAIAMDDLDQVRAVLGYESINLYGVSYGTRAALSYARQYPHRVRAMILDGLAPPDLVLGPYVARDAQRAFDLILERCAADEACKRAFPNIRANWEALLTTLEQEPVRVTLDHPVTGAQTELTLTRDAVATTVRLLSYAPETAALLPLLIDHAHRTGDYQRLAAHLLMVSEQLDSSLNSGMGNSVLCAEDAPFIQPEGATQDTYLGNLQIEQLRETCAVWPRGQVPPDFKQPVRSDVPTLLLSGEADPVTPPEYAEQAAQTLPNSVHIIAPGQGHSVVFRGCIPQLVAQFIESGSVQDLDMACVQNIKPTPFFLSFTGPQS